MTDALPKGLIVKTEGTNSNIERLNTVDVADIAQLWRVYTTNTNFVDDEAGARLENFFWRIWSSSRIYETIQGPALARLFARISDGSQSIRTTPVPSPPKPPPSRKKGVELVTPLAPLDDSPSNPILPSPPRAHTGSRSSSGSNGKEKTPEDAARAPLPPPILKKGRADSDDPPKTTRIIVPEPEETLVTRPEPPQRRESEKNAANQGRKKTVFVATGANSKRRPVLARRKSSRSPTSATTSAKQSPVLAPQKGTPPDLASAIAISSKPATSGGSWQDTSSFFSSRFPTDLKSNTTTTTTTTSPRKSPLSTSRKDSSALSCEPQPNQPSTATLVDKDFRTRFAEKKIRELGISSSPGNASTMMPPPPVPLPRQQQQQQQQQQQPTSNAASKKNGNQQHEQQLDSSRTQTPRSASTPIYPPPEAIATTATTTTTTAPLSAVPRRDGNTKVTPSPSASSSKSQSQLSSLIEADRRKRMAGS